MGADMLTASYTACDVELVNRVVALSHMVGSVLDSFPVGHELES